MLRRQFSGQKLLDQLRTGSAKRRLENDCQPMHKTKIFADITNTVDSVLTDLELETVEVANILACVKPAQIGISENTPFALVSDYDESITKWVTSVIQHACNELLTQDNKIKPALLSAIPASVSNGLTAEDLILSYFHALKSASETLIKQKLRHVYFGNPQQCFNHIDNVYFVFDNRTHEDILAEIIKQELNKRNPAQNQAENLSASMISLKRYGYSNAQWALGWQSPSLRPGANKLPPTIKARP